MSISQRFMIRPATPEDGPGIAFVRVFTWKAAYKGLISEEYLGQMDMLADARRWSDGLRTLEETGRCAYIVEDQERGQVVGYSIAGAERTGDEEYTGELYALYVLPEYQRSGLGRALVKAAADWLYQHGCAHMIIYALRENIPARQFYERMGGKAVREKEVEIGGAPYIEVGFGYDLSLL